MRVGFNYLPLHSSDTLTDVKYISITILTRRITNDANYEVTVDVMIEGLNEYITDAVNEIAMWTRLKSRCIVNSSITMNFRSSCQKCCQSIRLDNDIKISYWLSDTERIHGHLDANMRFGKQVSEKIAEVQIVNAYQQRIGNMTIHQTLRLGLIAIHKRCQVKMANLSLKWLNYLIRIRHQYTSRSILGDITYYFEYCKAALINSEDASRIREHFRSASETST